MPSLPIVYRVDAADRIVYVNDAWDAFAHQNEGTAVVAAQVVGRPLWEFISDLSTRTIYRSALGRIRAGSELRFGFRCDSPSCRRIMEMQILLADEPGSVEFRSSTIAEDHRQPPAVTWAAGGSRDEDSLVRMCGWCNRIDVGSVWTEFEEALPQLRLMERANPPSVTHGICESCFQKMTAEITKV
jgi:hypothetical protein